MVAFEAARSICVLPVDARDMSPAISSLQMFLGSPKPTLRFAAARVLSQVALTQPMVVTRCNDDLETLISDSNRSIATLAITTLLKTGTASCSPNHALHRSDRHYRRGIKRGSSDEADQHLYG